jgi:hypothetical protein
MPEMPFAVTGQTLEEIKSQVNELLRTLFEDRLGGYDRTLLDPSKLLSLNASKDVVSTEASGYASGIIGTSNQVTVTDNGDGTVTLSTPQNIHTGASPTFVGESLSGLTASRLVSTDGTKALESSDMTAWVAGTTNQIDITDDGDGTITLSMPNSVDMTNLEAQIYYTGGR